MTVGMFSNRAKEISEDSPNTEARTPNAYVEDVKLAKVTIISSGDDELDAVNLGTKLLLQTFDELRLTDEAKIRAWNYIEKRVQDVVYAKTRAENKAREEARNTQGLKSIFGVYS